MKSFDLEQHRQTRAASSRSTFAAVMLGGCLGGLAVAAGVASLNVMAIAISQAVPPGEPELPAPAATAGLDTARFQAVAHMASTTPAPDRAAPGRRARPAGVETAGAALDPKVPVAEAVRSRGLLAALLSLEADGDTTETSEGLEAIAAPHAVALALAGSGDLALAQETSGSLQRRGSDRVGSVSIELATGGVRAVSYGEKADAKVVLDEPELEVASAGPAALVPAAASGV